MKIRLPACAAAFVTLGAIAASAAVEGHADGQFSERPIQDGAALRGPSRS